MVRSAKTRHVHGAPTKAKWRNVSEDGLGPEILALRSVTEMPPTSGFQFAHLQMEQVAEGEDALRCLS